MCETTHGLRMCPPRHPCPPPPAAVPRPRPFRCRSVQIHACHLKSISAVGSQPLKSSSSCSTSPPQGSSQHAPIPDGICTAGVLLVKSTNSAPAEGSALGPRARGGVGSRSSSRISHAMANTHVAIRIHVQTMSSPSVRGLLLPLHQSVPSAD